VTAHLRAGAVEVLAEVPDDRPDLAGGDHVHDQRMVGAVGAGDDGRAPSASRRVTAMAAERPVSAAVRVRRLRAAR
jgi:hypothetical protein